MEVPREISSIEIRSAIAFVSPEASSARRGIQQVKDIERELMPVEWIEPDERGYEYDEDQLIKLAGYGKVILRVGGDGSIYHLMRLLAFDERAEAVKDTPVLPVMGGYANDFARVLNGTRHAIDALRSRHVRPIRPLETSIVDPDGNVTTDLSLYAGFGDNAAGSHALDPTRCSPNGFMRAAAVKAARKAMAAWAGVAQYPGIRVEDEPGNVRAVGGLMVSAGDNVARWGRLHARIDRDEFEEIQTRPQGFTDTFSERLRARGETLADMIRVGRGSLPSVMHSRPRSFFMYSLDGLPIPGQSNGENFAVPSGSQVTVGLSESAINMVTTRLTRSPLPHAESA